MVTCGGTIIVARSNTNNTFFPLNSYFAKTYPINVLVMITAAVTTITTRILLINHWAIGAFSNAVRYPSIVHFSGKNFVLFIWISALLLNYVINIHAIGYIMMSEKTVRNAIITIWCFLYTFFFFFIIHNSNPHASFYSESSLQ